MLQKLAFIAELKKCVQTFGVDAQAITGDANKFIGEAMITFDKIEMMIVVNKLDTIEKYADAIRVPFLRILGWYQTRNHANTRLRARDVLDMITDILDSKKPMAGLALCREALDFIYSHVEELAYRFAFDPDRYAESVIEGGGWNNTPNISLFSIQCNLELGKYNTLGDFARDLQELADFRKQANNDASNPLYHYANFITRVAQGLTSAPKKRSYADIIHYNGKGCKMNLNKVGQVQDAPPTKCIRAQEWSTFKTDYGSPVWSLEWHGGDQTDPYTLHIKMLIRKFEAWAQDVPLCTELIEHTRFEKTSEGWTSAANKLRAEKDREAEDVLTLSKWNTMRRRIRIFRGVAKLLTHAVHKQGGSTGELPEFALAIQSFQLPKMDTEIRSALSHAWACFLHFRMDENVKAQQMSNIQYLKNAGDKTVFPGAAKGKGVFTQVINAHIKDALLMHNRDFLRHWASIPTYDSAKAICDYEENCDGDTFNLEEEDPESEVDAAVLREVYEDAKATGQDELVDYDDVAKMVDHTDRLEAHAKRILAQAIEPEKREWQYKLCMVYGSEDKLPSTILKCEDNIVESAYALKHIADLEEGVHMLPFTGGHKITFTLSAQQIDKAGELWLELQEAVSQTEWAKDILNMVEQEEERTGSKLAAATNDGEDIEEYAKTTLFINQKLLKLGDRVLIAHRSKMEGDQVFPFTNYEMDEIMKDWHI